MQLTFKRITFANLDTKVNTGKQRVIPLPARFNQRLPLVLSPLAALTYGQLSKPKISFLRIQTERVGQSVIALFFSERCYENFWSKTKEMLLNPRPIQVIMWKWTSSGS